MNEQPVYPSRELLRKGPPKGKEPTPRKEKWCRVAQVVGVDQGGFAEFEITGPFTIPMGVRRTDVSLGESDKAWVFFTHPYSVFQRDGGFFNMPTRQGILAATLVGRNPQGIILYDEVGVRSNERVASDYCGALGIMRHRLFAHNALRAPPFYVNSFIRLDLMLLRTFRVLTLLLKTKNPKRVFQELDGLLRNRTVFTFFREEFNKTQLASIQRGARVSAAAAQGPTSSVSMGQTGGKIEQPFAISNSDFMTSDRLRDGKGRQIVAILKKRLDRFRTLNKDMIDAIDGRRAEIDQYLTKLRGKIEAETQKREQMASIGRFFSGRMFNIDQAKDEAAALERESQELDRKFENLEGYPEIKELTRRFQDFNQISQSIERLSTNIFDYNVSLNHIKELEDLAQRIRDNTRDIPTRTKDLNRYALRLRVDIAPRIMRVFAISAYVLRRPEALVGMNSGGNVGRVNRMAEKLIEYFRHVSFDGKHTLGEIFDDGWGQVRLLEARL